MRKHAASLVVGLVLCFVARYAAAEGARDESADVNSVLTTVLLDRIAAHGEEPAGAYIVLLAESLQLCREESSLKGSGCSSIDPGPRLAKGEAWPEVPADLQRALVGANLRSRDLPAVSLSGVKTARRKAVYEIFSGKGWWKEFYEKFPGSRGFVETTVPVFSDDRSHALTYVSHSCGGLCGTGWLLYLVRGADGWKIEKRRMLWIS